ncbi:MAG: glycosyltransferase family 39 protein [Acidobacteriota bacterium]
MVKGIKNAKPATLVVCAILGAALLLRVINLDADPSALISRDFITDEGWWAHNARNALFYGEWRIDEYNLGLYSAYLYNFLLYVTFKLFGISFTTLRMLSALCGWLTVIMLFDMARREISTRAAFFASVLLGFSNLHIVYSRTGFTESVMVFFLAFTLWSWSIRRTHQLFALIAGVSLGLMVVTKITAIYFIPGFVLAGAAAAIRHSLSRREALLFLSGTGLVGAAYGILFIVPNFGDWLRFNLQNGSGSEWSTRPSSLIDSIPRLLASPFYAEAPLITALTVLSLCLLVVGASRNGLTKTIRAAGELEITSAMLLIGYLFFLSITRYQPERRFIPALLLMVVLSACVLEKGWASLEGLANADYQMSAVGWFTVLFLLPTIGIVEVKWRVLGPPLSAGSWVSKLLIIAGLIVIAVALSRGLWPYRFKRSLLVASRLIFIVLFSFLSLGIVYKALLLWGLSAETWRSAVTADRVTFLAGSAVAIACVLVSFRLLRNRRHAAPLLLGVFLFIEGIQISTWLLQPTYTLKEANASLAGTLTQDDTIVTYYETVLLSSSAKVICRSTRREFNVDVFEKSNPNYILVLRRDNWIDYTLENMPPEEWPPPARFTPTKIAGFDLCPTRLRGPRFIVELYSLSPRVKRHKRTSVEDAQ